jgi:exonuclease SbcC
MKPRRLRIKGLNSFIEEQEIDFERLTEKGLFGIFGPTGSGKSTILDAITLSLYGTISRDAKEFMNTLCSSLSVSYEFEIGVGGERKVYIADRIVNKDKAGTYKLKTSRLRDITGGQDIPIAEGSNEVKNTVEAILGLTSDDFTRSVVLPQGKFNEFLRLGGKERRNMLERIFRLEKFGRNLGDKIRNLKKQKNDSLNILFGRIKSYEEQGVSVERYELLKETINNLLIQEEALKGEKISLDEEYEKYKIVWSLQQELNNFRLLEQKEESLRPEIEYKRIKLLKAKNALSTKAYIDAVEETAKKLINCEEEIKTTSLTLEEIKHRLVETEVLYKEAMLKKEKELPLIIEKETNLSRAIELQEKIKMLKAERAVLAGEYSKRNKELNDMKENLDKLLKKREVSLRERETIENRLDKIKIDPDYREDLQSAFNLQGEQEKSLEEHKTLINKIEEKTLIVQELDNRIKEITKYQNEFLKEIAVTEEKIEELTKKYPGDSSILIEKKNKLFELDAIIKEAEINSKKKMELTDNLNKLTEEKEQLEKNILSMTAFIEDKKTSISKLEEDITHMEAEGMASLIAADLKEEEPCPVCGSKHHPKLANRVDSEVIEKLRAQKQQLKELIEKEEKNIRSSEVNLASIKRNEEYLRHELKVVLAKLEGKELTELKKSKMYLENEYERFNKEIEEWNKSKETTEKELYKRKDEKNSIDKNEVKLSENLKSEKNLLDTFIKDEIQCKENCKRLKEELSELKIKLSIENIREEAQKLKELDKESNLLQKNLKSCIEEISKSDNEKEQMLNSIKEVEIVKGKIEESGKEKRNVIEREEADLKILSEDRDPAEYIAEVRTIRRDIIEKEETLRGKLENGKEELQRLSNKLLSCETSKLGLLNLKKEQDEKLNIALEAGGFSNKEEAALNIISTDSINALDEEINAYEDKMKNIRTNISTLSFKLGDNSISEDAWIKLQERRIEVAKLYELRIKELAAQKQIFKELEKNLEELIQLNINKKELEHVCSNLDDLAKLVEGNKFVEFVAMNQLKYISVEASKRLKGITRGRYALEIDSTGNFIMRDDFNGGARRATNTLSGGETFLTSLCLALALSSQIQLKGSAPLEFFFLDEGFGTLDNDLLETVMTSLERLHSDRLCVGIISHVEDLKSRVPVKLLVEPAEHGKFGSKVRIDLS